LVEGTVSRVAQFGAFVSLDLGIEALLHASQMADPIPEDPTLLLHEGQRLLMRVISIEADRQRLGLSLKEVSAEELARWQEARAESQDTQDYGSIDDVNPVQLEGQPDTAPLGAE
jgi:small subunit ribosomal protein S1